MADGPSTSHDDFLAQEVQQSGTDEAIKAETLATLARAEEIKALFGNNGDIQQEYDDVRMATLGALKDLRISTSQDLDAVRQSTAGNADFSTLSDGNISSEESRSIQNELQELEANANTLREPITPLSPITHIGGGLSGTLSGVTRASTPLMSTPLQSSPVEVGEMSMSTIAAVPVAATPPSIDTLHNLAETNREIQEYIHTTLNEVFSQGIQSREQFAGLFMNREEHGFNFQRDFYKEPFSTEIVNFITSNPTYLQTYIENDLSFVLGCSRGEEGEKMIQLQANIREAYLELQENRVKESIQNYLLNAGVSETQIEELEADGSFNELIQNLREGDCNIENIARIRSFNEAHFPEHDLTLTEEDARNILGTTIELRRTENELALANLRDELSQITEKSFDEIQAIIDSHNPETIGIFLDAYRNTPRVGEIESRIFELLDIGRAIAAQAGHLDEVARNAEAIYQMTEPERAEYRRLLMSFTGSSININVSREVHRMYILEKPKERLRLLNSAEDLLILLPEIDPQTITIQDIKSQFLLIPEVLRYFTESSLREEDYKFLPPDIFNNLELCSILGKDRPYNWDILFYNIMMAQGTEESVTFLQQLIFENPGVFRNENDRTALEEAIPKSVRDTDRENLLIEIGVYEPEINTTTSFNEQVQRYLDYYNSETYSQEAEIDTGEGIERRSTSWSQNLNEYIRNYGVSPEIYDSIRSLIEAGRNNDIPLLLTSLNPNTEEELGIILQAIENYDVNYHFLSFEAKRHPQVLRKIGENGNFEDFGVEQYITDEKRLANYLIGYSKSGRDVGDFIYSEEIEVIRSNLSNNTMSGNIELSDEEIETLNNFRISMRERGEEDNFLRTLSDIEEVEESKVEILKQNIRTYLSEYISQEEINVVLEYLETRDTDNFWSSLRGYLIEAGISDEERRNILQETSNLVLEVRREQRRIAGEEARDTSLLTPEEIALIENSRYFENGEFNEEAILENFQIFVQNTLTRREDASQIGDRIFIERYLLSLNLPESVLNKKRETFVQLIQRQSDEIEAHVIANLVHNDPNRFEELVERGIGSFAQNQVYQQIYSGEINFSSSGDSKSSQQQGAQNGQSSSQGTGNNNFSHERISVSGENIYYSAPSGEQIPLSQEEARMIEDNPEAEGNLVEFYTTLTKLNLEEFWNYREYIFKAIQNKSAISGLNARDGNYLDKSEMALFLYTIADSISDYVEEGEKAEIESYRGEKQDFNRMFSLLLKLNRQGGVFTNQEDMSIMRNESRIGRIFRREFFGQEHNKDEQSLAGFSWGKFQAAI